MMVSYANVSIFCSTRYEAFVMNRINPKKLLLSKWTAVTPQNKERHFIVTELIKDDDNQITGCQLEAVINHHVYAIDWQLLKNSEQWRMGWH